MIRAKIIDIIKSALGCVLRIDNLAEYKESYVEADMQPNTLAPWSLVLEAIPTTVGSYEVDITAQSSFVIDWQTDLIDGVQTYAEALGNIPPKAFHYFITVDGDIETFTRGGVEPVVVRDSGLITTVTFDWGYDTDCAIVF